MNAVILLHKHFFGYPLIVLCLLCLAFIVTFFIREYMFMWPAQKLHEDKPGKKPTIKKTAWYIFSASLLFVFIVLIFAPYKILRYVMPVFPFLILLPAMLINSMEIRSKKAAVFAMLILCVCFTFNAVREKNIESIFRNKPNEYVFTRDKDTPVYVVNAALSIWKYANLIPYLHDEQAYYFIDWLQYFDEYKDSGWQRVNINLPDVEDYDAIYLLTEYFPDFPQYNGLVDMITGNLPAAQSVAVQRTVEFEINTGEPESWYPYFKGMKIIMSER